MSGLSNPESGSNIPECGNNTTSCCSSTSNCGSSTPLIYDVKTLMQNYSKTKHDPINNTDRKKGCDELYEIIKALIPEKVKRYASYGHDEARIFEFKFKEELKYDKYYAKDLLTKGDVIPRLQKYLDTEHSDEAGPSFLVYFTQIGRFQVNPKENKFGVFVNWNKDKWGMIKSRVESKQKPKAYNKPTYKHPDKAVNSQASKDAKSPADKFTVTPTPAKEHPYKKFHAKYNNLPVDQIVKDEFETPDGACANDLPLSHEE